MRTPTESDLFPSIDAHELDHVSGGASRVTARSGGGNDQLALMLTQITESIKGLTQNNQSDPMQQLMMMMMMMGGMGGGGGGPAAGGPPPGPPPGPTSAPSTPVINVTVKRYGC